MNCVPALRLSDPKARASQSLDPLPYDLSTGARKIEIFNLIRSLDSRGGLPLRIFRHPKFKQPRQ